MRKYGIEQSMAINVRKYSINKTLGDQRAKIHVSENFEAIEAFETIEDIEAFEAIEGIEPFETIEAIETIETIEAIEAIKPSNKSKPSCIFACYFYFPISCKTLSRVPARACKELTKYALVAFRF